MEITIISPYSNRPEFMEIQHKTLKKHIKNNFKWLILNNAYYDKELFNEIEKNCKKLGAKSFPIEHDESKYGDKNDYASVIGSNTINYAWKNKLSKLEGIIFLLDCDMFFIGDLDIERLMENTELVYVPVYTNNKEWTWPCCMLLSNLQNSNEIDFGFYPIDGQHCDSGSAMYCYLQKYKPKVKHFERNAILDEQNELLEFLDFPHPYSIDYLKFDNKPIVFHYKTSSNYAPHCTSEYNKKKTIALKKLLKYYNGND